MSGQGSPIDRLVAELGKLPGIGAKTAARLAFFLLNHPKDDALALAQAIVDLKERVGHCSICWNITDVDPCHFCSDAKRDRGIICVVEQASDLVVIENTGEFRGLYHVLMGTLSPINGVGPEELTLKGLVRRLEGGEVGEVIIATNPTVEGEATAFYLAQLLKPLGVKVSRIAQGLPVGSNLEYADKVTMTRSLATRREMD
ncbi:MAG TPA: recombination mediator RecR [Acidobacteriota bacterium]|nr:recombination mediator RecR [Acidobacteriota bacterium]